jgi:iron complex outermembrane receptor protein
MICFCGMNAVAQSSLSGVIKEKSTGKPLYHVTIYIPELQLGTVSEEDGSFRLSGLASGTFNISFSYVGFKSQIISVTLANENVSLSIELENTGIEGEEVVVFGTKNSDPDRTPVNISTMSQSEARELGAYSISDALAKLPGMSQLTTGKGISKPVIRGLYGNRIQTQVLGIRFDNQQWQDEHGLGLSDDGIDRIEIIKGPAAIMYGSEAMGGVLNIIDEKPADVGKLEQDINLRMFSNTVGGALDYGAKKSNERNAWKLRFGAESYGDYLDGNDNRVYNTRFDGITGKGTYSFWKNNWHSTNNLITSFNRYGFLMDSSLRRIDTTASRWSRNYSGPHHQVFFTVLTSQNTIYEGQTKWKINLGIHSNLRQEQEGGNKISLEMLLNTFAGDVQWVRDLNQTTEFTAGVQPMFQVNSNFGSRVIVPDATLFENGIFGYLKKSWNKLVLETGLRFDLKDITAYETSDFTFSDDTVPGEGLLFLSPNGSLGIAYKPAEKFSFKINVSSGYRAPNLAELYSNGLHEGTLRWEIGDADLKKENNINPEVAAIYETKIFSANISAYYNQIFNYIYLNPTGEKYYGFDIYEYVQKDANLTGGEVSLDVSPSFVPLDLSASYSIIRGQTSDDENLPFIPSDKILAQLKANLFNGKHPNETYVMSGIEYHFAQDKVGQFETPTDAYTLVNLGAGTVLHFDKQIIELTLFCNNLLDVAYVDALSRYKDYGILNPGRDINLNIRMPF